MENTKQYGKLGFYGGLVIGIGYFLYGFLIIINKAPRYGKDPSGFMNALISGDEGIWFAYSMIFMIANIAGIAMAISYRHNLSNNENAAGLEFFTMLGILGFVLNSYAFADYLGKILRVAGNYQDLSSDAQASINAQTYLGDPTGILRVTLISIWLFAIVYYANKEGVFSKPLSLVVVIGGLDYFLFAIDRLFLGSTIGIIINMSAAILGPLIFIWMGFAIRDT